MITDLIRRLIMTYIYETSGCRTEFDSARDTVKYTENGKFVFEISSAAYCFRIWAMMAQRNLGVDHGFLLKLFERIREKMITGFPWMDRRISDKLTLNDTLDYRHLLNIIE